MASVEELESRLSALERKINLGGDPTNDYKSPGDGQYIGTQIAEGVINLGPGYPEGIAPTAQVRVFDKLTNLIGWMGWEIDTALVLHNGLALPVQDLQGLKIDGDLAVLVDAATKIPYEIFACVEEAPVGADLVVDFNVGGVLYQTITIVDGQASVTIPVASSSPAFTAIDPTLLKTLDVTQVGSTTPGKNFRLLIKY